jgi:hypothetical protein
LEKISPTSNDCYVKTKDEMIDIIQKKFPKNTSIFDKCDGGPEVGIIPPDGEIELKKYIRHIVFPPKENISNSGKKYFEKSSGISIDEFYKVASPLKGGKKHTKKTRKCGRKPSKHLRK